MYSETAHTHDESEFCISCFISKTMATFNHHNVDPFTALGILDVIRFRILDTLDAVMSDEGED